MKKEKKCGKCKQTFPLTNEHFFTKTTKKGTVVTKGGNPLLNDSTSFRSDCKSCHSNKGQARKRKKLMIKYNASSEVELDTIITEMRTRAGMKGAYANFNVPSKRRKYKYPAGATTYEMAEIRRKMDMGYDPETYDAEWKKKWTEKAKQSRVYNYPEGTEKVTQQMLNRMTSANLTDAFIANRLGFKLSEVPQEILELKRKQLKFFRLCQEQTIK